MFNWFQSVMQCRSASMQTWDEEFFTHSLGLVLTSTLRGPLLWKHCFKKFSTSWKGLKKTRSPLMAKIFFPTSSPAICSRTTQEYQKSIWCRHQHICVYVTCLQKLLWFYVEKHRYIGQQSMISVDLSCQSNEYMECNGFLFCVYMYNVTKHQFCVKY